jgi:hypothetical protein
MKTLVKVGAAAAILVIAMAAAVLILYSWPHYVKLELAACLQNPSIDVNDGAADFDSEKHWWFIGRRPDSYLEVGDDEVSPNVDGHGFANLENLERWGVDFDEIGINFDENNAVLAFSRKIKKMKFDGEYWFPYCAASTVRTMMAKEFEPDVIYVYRIPKYVVAEDIRAPTEAYLEE